VLLEKVCETLRAKGFTLVNIDSTVIAQAPKLKDFIPHMRQNIASACGIDVSCVSVKATTEEKLGFTGAGLGISAQAVALVESL
jgi:2-C-methyl-D-erythritol 2,4-cyclodiphosphate synthase